jgi:hypothetical protein
MISESSQYRFLKPKIQFFLPWILFCGVAIGPVIYGLLKHQNSPLADVLLISLFALMVLNGISVMRASADVMLTDRGISRTLLGYVFETVKWEDVASFRQSARLLRDGTPVTVMRVVPKNRALQMVISEKFENFATLVSQLNEKIREFGIPVQIKIGNTWQRRTALMTDVSSN